MKWPRELRQPLFLVGAALYLLSITQKRGGALLALPWWPPLLASYLADVLTLPLELTLLRWYLGRYYFRRPDFVLPTSWIAGSWAFTSLWFEGMLPRFDARATADPLDVVAYAVGGLLFWRWLNRPAVA